MIAIAIAAVAAAVVGLAMANEGTKNGVKELGTYVGETGYKFTVMSGNMAGMTGTATAAAQKMLELAKNTTLAAKAAGTFGQKADNSDIFKRGSVTPKKGASAPALTQAEKDLEAFKKLMKEMGLLGGAGSVVAGGAKKAAKAIANPFKEMVKSIQEDMARVSDSIMNAFDITNMGRSGGSISRNIDKFMVKLRQFSGYIQTLRGMNLNSNLLQQLAMAGPEAGLAAAKAFAGSPGLVAQANAAYGELGMEATAIAGNVVGAKAAPIYNITVSGGVGSGATIGKAVVAAIQQFELQSGDSWRRKA